MMGRVRGKNTKPELLVRKALHHRGYRYRLHDRRLPGRPDIHLPKWSAVIQINGCFWHGHDCPLFRLPGTRREFWREKIDRNRSNDRRNTALLLADGIRVATVWECALRGQPGQPVDDIAERLADWLDGDLPVLDVRAAAPIGRRAG